MATDSRTTHRGRKPCLGPPDQARLISARDFADPTLETPWKSEREAGRLVVMSPDSKEHDVCSEPIRDHLGADRLAHRDLIGDLGIDPRGERFGRPIPDRVPDPMFKRANPGPMAHDRDDQANRTDYNISITIKPGNFDPMAIQEISLACAREPADCRERTLRPNDTPATALRPERAVPLREILR